ncbi:Crp/Fnr family transcriptional regulator [Winogradskyella sp.]|uniref:Crp/Fnr family transcriptional regulator n=1 Tax=Winogradskyella sp. TaxID=1883156 RepID=UPI003239B89E
MHNKESLINFILNVVDISKQDAQDIVKRFKPIALKEKEFLLQEQEFSDAYLYLEKGVMRTFLYDLKGNEITIDFFTDNSIVFEVNSFFNRVRSEANIQAITDCYGYTVTYDELNTLFHNKPAFRDFGRALLVKKFSTSQKRNFGLINKTAIQRYQNLMASQPQIFQYSPLKYIASYLGVTDSTLSRLRKKM